MSLFLLPWREKADVPSVISRFCTGRQHRRCRGGVRPRSGYTIHPNRQRGTYQKCPLTSWIEDCAEWCVGGWRVRHPQLGGLIRRWLAFRRGHLRLGASRHAAETMTTFLWEHRNDDGPAQNFVEVIRTALVNGLIATEPSLADQGDQVDRMTAALADDGALAGLSLRGLGGRDGSPDHLNLLTLHSAKGCEYDVVIMLGMDLGCIPWANESGSTLRESRQLFYVGLTERGTKCLCSTRASSRAGMAVATWVDHRSWRSLSNGLQLRKALSGGSAKTAPQPAATAQ